MKYFLLLFITIHLISCSDKSEAETDTEIETVANEEEIPIVEDTLEMPDEDIKRNYSLKEFPSLWWMLSVEGEEMSIINHWDAQEMNFEITAETDSTGFIDLMYAHDSDGGPLFAFKAELTEQGDSGSLIDGSFSFLGTMQSDTTHVNFHYDRLNQYAEFNGLYFNSEAFVEDALKDVFPYVETVREPD